MILEYGVTDDGLVGLTNANLTVENSLFDHTDRRRIRSQDSSLIVRNSTFATLFAPDSDRARTIGANTSGAAASRPADTGSLTGIRLEP